MKYKVPSASRSEYTSNTNKKNNRLAGDDVMLKMQNSSLLDRKMQLGDEEGKYILLEILTSCQPRQPTKTRCSQRSFQLLQIPHHQGLRGGRKKQFLLRGARQVVGARSTKS